MTKIRTAIIGYGRNGSTMHAGGIANNSAFEMVAVCDVDPECRIQAAERFGCAVYEDYTEMLAKEHLNLVIIVTRSDQHCRMTCDCLAAGVHVLVTKPWAVNENEARSMIEAADKSGRLLLPWLPARWGCDLKRLKQLFAEKAIGNVFMIRRAVSSFGTRCDWQTERRYSGGYLLNWGLHIIDPPILLAGGKAASVYGWMKQTINPGDVEDNFLAIITLDNGVLIRAEYTVAVEDVPNWFIQGDRGTIVIRGQHLKIYKNTPAQPDDPTQYATMKPKDNSSGTVRSVNVHGQQLRVYENTTHIPPVKRKRLPEVLLEQGLVTEAQLKECLAAQRSTGDNLAQILVQKGYLDEEELVVTLSEQLGIPHIRVGHYKIPKEVLAEVPERLARKHLMLPISTAGDVLTLAMANPLNIIGLDDLRMVTNYDIERVVAVESELKAAIDKNYGSEQGKEPSGKPSLVRVVGESTVIEEHLDGEIYGDTDEIYAEIAEGILGPDPYPVTPQHALELTRILDAIRASSESNRVVTL